MGVEQSNLVPSEVKYGFNVLRVDENSPAAAVKLVPYFEYIVSVNGVEVVRLLYLYVFLLLNRFKKYLMLSPKWQKITLIDP